MIRAPLFKEAARSSGTPMRVISIKDFPAAGYLQQPQRTVILQNLAEKARAYTVQPLDVLVTIVGTIGLVTILPEQTPDNWVPATNMFVLRLRERDPRKARALYALLKSAPGQEVLDHLSHGSGIQIVSKKAFSRIAIPLLDERLLTVTESLWEKELNLFHESNRLLQQAKSVYSEIGR